MNLMPLLKPFYLLLSLAFICQSLERLNAQQDSVLMFISYDETYYTEYIVMYSALIDAGYRVSVRSASEGYATTYLAGGNFADQAIMLGGANGYNEFLTQYNDMFGFAWDASSNTLPMPGIPLDGSILDVSSIAGYKAFVTAGGTGAPDYRIDGVYSGQRELLSGDIQGVAEKLNALAVEALTFGIPILAQCHGASLPAFWRVPGTVGEGFDALGHSLLAGSIATGYPTGPETSTNLSNLGIAYRANDPVVIGSPNTIFNDMGMGESKLATSRDWFPQTVAHAAKTLINMIESYPNGNNYEDEISVLVVHGGAVNDCNSPPDIPCNHGTSAPNIPADFDTLIALLNFNSPYDDFDFNVDEVNLFNQVVFDPNNETSIYDYLNNYDVVFFYKHWATGLNANFTNAFVDYVDNGGGAVSIHHGLYHQNKGAIATDVFGALSTSGGWSASLQNMDVFNTNYGHFVSSYGIVYDGVSVEPTSVWSGNSNPLLSGSNQSLSFYQRFNIYDELYANMQFTGSPVFGDGIDEINPIFSNGAQNFGSGSNHQHVHGFVKYYDPSGDCSVGKVVYSQSGERSASYQLANEPQYAQFIRNAVFWAGIEDDSGYKTALWTQTSGATANWNVDANWRIATPNSCQNVVIPDLQSPLIIDLPLEPIYIKSLSVGQNVSLNVPSGSLLNVIE